MAFRKRREGSQVRRQTRKIDFRVDDHEHAQIQTSANRAGLTVGSYVRSRALEKPTTRAVRRPPVETAQLAQLLGIVGAVGGQIQALTQKHGAEIPVGEVQETMRAFREAAAAIMRTLGKRPALAQDNGP